MRKLVSWSLKFIQFYGMKLEVQLFKGCFEPRLRIVGQKFGISYPSPNTIFQHGYRFAHPKKDAISILSFSPSLVPSDGTHLDIH
jgi:hypothetical protein